MKKLWILFTALALLAVAMPAVADVTTGLDFYWHGVTDFDAAQAAVMDKARIRLSAGVDEFNTIATELRYSNAGDWDPAAVRVKKFTLATDITGALGLDLPVKIKSTVGVWESDFYKSYYATRAGKSYVNAGQVDEMQSSGAAQLDFAVGPANIHYYQNMGAGTESTMMAGADAAFGPVAVSVSYKADPGIAFGDGSIGAEAKYAGTFGDLALSVYPAVNYNLGTEVLGWDVGVKVGYKMLTAAVSAGSKDADVEAFDLLEAEAGYAMGNAALWAAAYMSLAADDAFQGFDVMASYKFGAATVYAGYVFCPDTTTVTVPVDGDEWNTLTGGLYLGVKCSL